MEELGKIRIDQQVIDSLVFYFMLSISLTSRGVPESVATKSLQAYVKEGKENGVLTHPEILGAHLQAAYAKLPSEFLHIHDIPTTLGDGIRTIDVNYSWVNKL